VNIVLILANGPWIGDVDARRRAAAARFVIAADGGFAKALAAGARVDLVVGDFDSLDPDRWEELARSGADVRQYPAAKDWSDLELALDEALKRKPDEIVILGALGRRLDHELTNIHLLERGLSEHVPVILVDGSQSVRLVDDSHEVAGAAVGDLVSLIPISESVRATTSGLAYPLRDEVLQRAASRGVSNVVSSLPVTVDVSSGRLLVIHGRPEAAR
jgi:thiamine pyrophosphokinase